MHILNRSDAEIRYEIKAGPMRMTMSTCDLAPGEEEVWTSPYKRHTGTVRCEVRLSVEGVTTTVEADDDATILVDGSAADLRVTVEG